MGLLFSRLPSALSRAWDRHVPSRSRLGIVAALESIRLLTCPRFYPLRPACFSPCFLHLCYDGAYALRPHSCLRCDFDAVSSGLPPPFSSFSRSSLVCLCCHCGCSLFYSFGFLYSLLPPSRHYAQHVLTSTVITLRPFTPYFNSWCLLLAIYYYTPLPWWFSGTHP